MISHQIPHDHWIWNHCSEEHGEQRNQSAILKQIHKACVICDHSSKDLNICTFHILKFNILETIYNSFDLIYQIIDRYGEVLKMLGNRSLSNRMQDSLRMRGIGIRRRHGSLSSLPSSSISGRPIRDRRRNDERRKVKDYKVCNSILKPKPQANDMLTLNLNFF